jgi:hydroxymethylpyrimidine/phosphomethylpyrimidine kinase
MTPCALSIAGSDPSGGAGIQADVRTFTMLGTFGAAAITAVTVQNTTAVEGVVAVPPDLVRQQIDCVVRDAGAIPTKTGMLLSAATVGAVASAVRDHGINQLIVDPVTAATSGAQLGQPDLPEALMADLIPHALLVTPNALEATLLTGIPVASVADMRLAAEAILSKGARACLVKGGHLDGPFAVDLLVRRGSAREIVRERIPGDDPHGTGCMLSASITAFLARGMDLDSAVENAKEFVHAAIRESIRCRGRSIANPLTWHEQRIGHRSRPKNS